MSESEGSTTRSLPTYISCIRWWRSACTSGGGCQLGAIGQPWPKAFIIPSCDTGPSRQEPELYAAEMVTIDTRTFPAHLRLGVRLANSLQLPFKVWQEVQTSALRAGVFPRPSAPAHFALQERPMSVGGHHWPPKSTFPLASLRFSGRTGRVRRGRSDRQLAQELRATEQRSEREWEEAE